MQPLHSGRLLAVCERSVTMQAQPGKGVHARRQALASLKTLLADPAAAVKRDGRPAVDAAFAQQALARLTAPELAALTDWQAAAANQASIPW